jgi:hypothetical protein
MTDISKAAAAMGRRGGSVTSPRKAKAVRENGKLGGRPIKYCPACIEELDEQIALANGTCNGCGSYFANAVKSSEVS